MLIPSRHRAVCISAGLNVYNWHKDFLKTYWISVMWHYSWVYVGKLLLKQIGHQWQTNIKKKIPQEPNLVSQWVNWVYLQGCGWTVTRQCRNDSRTVTLPKPTAEGVTAHKSWSTLYRSQTSQQSGDYSFQRLWLVCLFQLGWSLLLPRSLDVLRMTVIRPYCLYSLWRGGA